MSPLRQRMIEDMNSRKLGPYSQRSHISSCKRFAAFLRRSPETATCEDIRLFQLHLAETGMSICNRIMTGVRFLFRVTLRRLDLSPSHLREPQKNLGMGNRVYEHFPIDVVEYRHYHILCLA